MPLRGERRTQPGHISSAGHGACIRFSNRPEIFSQRAARHKTLEGAGVEFGGRVSVCGGMCGGWRGEGEERERATDAELRAHCWAFIMRLSVAGQRVSFCTEARLPGGNSSAGVRRWSRSPVLVSASSPALCVHTPAHRCCGGANAETAALWRGRGVGSGRHSHLAHL